MKCANHFLKIVVPYAGTITIAAGEFLQDQRRLKGAVQDPINRPPVFTLSHGIFQTSQDLHQLPAWSDVQPQAAPSNGIQMETDDIFNVPYLDLDWSGMINVQADADWAWLNDVNNGTTGFL